MKVTKEKLFKGVPLRLQCTYQTAVLLRMQVLMKYGMNVIPMDATQSEVIAKNAFMKWRLW
jgi:hypothetical protein